MKSEISKTIVYGIKGKNLKNIIFVTEADFFVPPRDFCSEILGINEINNIENKIIYNKSISNWFLYNEISLWWYYKPALRKGCTIFINFIKR